jgi:electron transport complex protein RnfG
MSKSLQLVLVLTVTAVISGAVLSVLNSYTAPKIALNQDKELQEAIGQVLPNKKSIDLKIIDGVAFYLGKDEKGVPIGVAFVAEGDGFQSRLRILVGMDVGLTKILKIKILAQAETPGLGTKIENDPTNKTDACWFANQFANLPLTKTIGLVKNQPADPQLSQIQAITGATISSKAVVDILNTTITKNRELFLKRDK